MFIISDICLLCHLCALVVLVVLKVYHIRYLSSMSFCIHHWPNVYYGIYTGGAGGT